MSDQEKHAYEKEGYFHVANDWWDMLIRTRIPGEQMQCVLYVIRRTYGYRQIKAKLKLAQFVGATGINKGSVYRALQKLKDRKILIIKKATNGDITYQFNKRYCEWKQVAKKQPVVKKQPIVDKKATIPIKNNTRNKERNNMSGKKPDGDGQGKIEKAKEDIAIAIIRKTIEYLNEQTGKKFQYTSQSSQKFIRGRLSQGYTLEDFKHVVDVKCSQWLDDDENEMYLRPETLFNEKKFQTYVNQKIRKESNWYRHLKSLQDRSET